MGARAIGLLDLRGGIGSIGGSGPCPYLLALTHSCVIFCHHRILGGLIAYRRF